MELDQMELHRWNQTEIDGFQTQLKRSNKESEKFSAESRVGRRSSARCRYWPQGYFSEFSQQESKIPLDNDRNMQLFTVKELVWWNCCGSSVWPCVLWTWSAECVSSFQFRPPISQMKKKRHCDLQRYCNLQLATVITSVSASHRYADTLYVCNTQTQSDTELSR